MTHPEHETKVRRITHEKGGVVRTQFRPGCSCGNMDQLPDPEPTYDSAKRLCDNHVREVTNPSAVGNG